MLGIAAPSNLLLAKMNGKMDRIDTKTSCSECQKDVTW